MFRGDKNTKRKGNGQMKWQEIENFLNFLLFSFAYSKNSRIFAITKKL